MSNGDVITNVDVNVDTLNRYVMSSTTDHDLVLLLNSIATSCKLIASVVQRAGIYHLYGIAGGKNVTGDVQKKLDIMANEMMVNSLINSGVCAVLVSEENEEPIIIQEGKRGKYCVAFDPLDGSSNIDCNVSVGTIFSVFHTQSHTQTRSGQFGGIFDILRRGEDCICAGYCVYSSAVELVITFQGKGVHGFCLDPSIGEFVHTRPNIKFPADGGKKIYAANEGNFTRWDTPTQNAVQYFKQAIIPYSARYVGSMVADIHRTILYGGIFMYPADSKSPDGKLRLLYEGIPMAMIIEQAGGAASTGYFQGKVGRILELIPDNIHSRCPIIMGSKRDVDVVFQMYRQSGIKAPHLENK